MLAHHPLTGKEIRILKTDAQIYKNQKTILWLRESSYPDSHRFKRWDTLTFGHELAHKWSPSAVVIREPTSRAIEWILREAPKSYILLFFSKKVIEAIGVEHAKALGFVNIMCLEELGEIYPQLLRVYSESDSDAEVFLMIAVLFRASRAFGLLQSELINPLVETYKQRYNLTTNIHQSPEPLWLIQQYYIPSNKTRAKEINKCFEKNLENPLIDKYILLNESKFPLHKSTNTLEQVVIGHRLKYSDIIKYIQTQVPKDTIVVFANSDIYITESFKDLWSINLHDVFLSLLRYEETTGELFGPRPDSQDTWIVYSNSVQERTWNINDLDFPFGKAGCDNAIGVEFLRRRFLVVNPCLSLKTMHVHKSEVRSYNPKDCVEKTHYLYLDPTGLHDLEPKKSMKDYIKQTYTPKAYICQVHASDERTLKTFCTMASRNESTKLEPYSANLLQPQKEELYQIKDSFMTPNSLVYGYKSMYLTSNEDIKNMWVSETISHLTSCIGLKSIVACPSTEESIDSSHTSYVQNYLGRILRLRAEGFKGDFWMPRRTEFQEWLQLFNWQNEKFMPVIPKDKDVSAFGENVYFLTPNQHICKETIQSLRQAFKTYTLQHTGPKRIVILQDDTLLTTPIVSLLEKELESLDYQVDIVYPKRSSPSILAEAIVGAHLCISGPECKDLYWLLPSQIRIIDCMSETKIDGTNAQYAGACDLEYWVVLLPRGKPEAIAKICLDKIKASLKEQQQEQQQEQSKKPTIIMPIKQEGFHHHNNDTFREMVQLWQEKGYVQVQESSQTPYVWYNEIGDILLYDRPTFTWIQRTPVKYTKILCGNPDGSSMANGYKWSFWPRSPRLVEELAPTLLETPRTKQLVFYGGSENAIQKLHRNNRLHEACDDYSMTDGSNYKFTQKEYLQALAQSKFGLCLAGFGLKCNREIECMALGTVPVLSLDVDMVHYANPPKKDVHYIQLHSFDPEDAKKQIQQISEEKWKEMSKAAHQWWKENASVEGMWLLTKRLVDA